MRKLALRAMVVLGLASCTHHDSESERDKKGRSTARMGGDPKPNATGAVTPLAPVVDDLTIYNVPVGQSPVRGASDALVTIVEFSDFQCPFCARAEPTLATLRAQYGADVRFVWKNEPMKFHPRAAPAACLAMEAFAEHGVNAFWDVHDAIYTLRQQLDDATLVSLAKDHGVDGAKAQTAITTLSCKPKLDVDDVLAQRVGAQSTPTFFINGRRLMGAQPVARFTHIIDDELQKAKDRVAQGTARAKIYDAIIDGGV